MADRIPDCLGQHLGGVDGGGQVTFFGSKLFAFEIQKLDDGRSMVYIPSSPSAFSGITQILPPDQITYLDVPVTKIIEITENFGHGAEKLLNEKKI